MRDVARDDGDDGIGERSPSGVGQQRVDLVQRGRAVEALGEPRRGHQRPQGGAGGAARLADRRIAADQRAVLAAQHADARQGERGDERHGARDHGQILRLLEHGEGADAARGGDRQQRERECRRQRCAQLRTPACEQQRHTRRESDEGERDERDDEEDSILIGHGTPAPTRDTARILIHAFHGHEPPSPARSADRA